MQDKEILSRLYNEIKPYRGRMLAAMASMVIVSLLSSLQAYMVKPLLDDIFFKHNREMLNFLPLLLIAVFAGKGIFYYSYNYLLSHLGQTVVLNLRQNLFDHIQNSSLSFIQKFSTGEIISRVVSDILLIQTSVTQSLVGIVKDLLMVIGLLGVIFFLNWKLALLSSLFLPISLLPIVYFGKKHRSLSKKNQEQHAFISSNLYEVVSGIRIVKAFCMESHESSKFASNLRSLFKTIIKDTQIKCINHPIMELIGGLGIALIIWYGGHQVIAGDSTPGTFFSFLTALIMLYDPIKNVSKINANIQQGIAAATRVFTFLDQKEKIEETASPAKLPQINEKIEFNNISFAYDEDLVLNNINIKVPQGQLLAIVGSSGSGKTSLVNLLPRFYDPASGAISIDGVDIRNVSLNSLRQQIGIVTQQSILFNDSIRHNIGYGAPKSTESQIINAAKSAYAWDFIKDLPQGLDTIIGESGARLSGGERQRLSIARALLKDAPILILDEATSALDTESEHQVQKALANLMKDRTTFVIAHRLSTIQNADRILVLHQGQIVEEGVHIDLLRQNGHYKKFHDIQGAEA